MYELKLHYTVSVFLTPLAYCGLVMLMILAIRHGLKPKAIFVLLTGYALSLLNHVVSLLAYLSIMQAPHLFTVPPAVFGLQMVADWGGMIAEVLGWAMFVPWLLKKEAGTRL